MCSVTGSTGSVFCNWECVLSVFCNRSSGSVFCSRSAGNVFHNRVLGVCSVTRSAASVFCNRSAGTACYHTEELLENTLYKSCFASVRSIKGVCYITGVLGVYSVAGLRRCSITTVFGECFTASVLQSVSQQVFGRVFHSKSVRRVFHSKSVRRVFHSKGVRRVFHSKSVR